MSSAAQREMEEGSGLHAPPETLYEHGDLSDGSVSTGTSDGLDWMGSLQSSDVSSVSSNISVATMCYSALLAAIQKPSAVFSPIFWGVKFGFHE